MHTNTPIKILAVDDVPQNLAAIEAVLAGPGVQIVRAHTGNEALERLLVEEVALALIDVRMPQMDGFELAELMRGAERTRDIPIIFMTAAERDPGRTFRGYEAGAVDFLHKPVDAQILKSKVGVFVELYSQRQRLSAQLEALRKALRVNEMFAAVLGHDLRNPLNAITMGAEVLKRASKDEMVLTTAERINSSARRMGKMIEQLLDVARIRAGGMTLQLKPGDVLQVCRTMRDELESSTRAGRIQLSAAGDTHAVFDPDRLSQVFSNLIGNALQHGDQQVPVAVTVDGAHQSVVKVRIGNRGTIPPEKLEALFEPFHSGATSTSGLGLGLFISSQFVEAHGGSVKVSTGQGDETVFEFEIPRAPRASEAQIRLDV